MKKVLIIITILIVLILGYVLSFPCDGFPETTFLKYFYNLKCQPSKDQGQKGSLPPINPPGNNFSQNNNFYNNQGISAVSKVKKVSDIKVLNYTVNKNGEVILIDESGKIIKKSGPNEEIIYNPGASFNFYKNISFSPDSSKIIFNFKDSASIFDVSSKTWSQIKKLNSKIAISLENKAAYFKTENGKNNIYQLDLTKKDASPTKLLETNFLDSELIWKDKENLLITTKPSSLNVNYVWLFNVKNKTLSVIYDYLGLYLNWNEEAKGGTIFYSGELGKGGEFYLVAPNFKLQKLNFITLPSKCNFYKPLSKENFQSNNPTSTNPTSTTTSTANKKPSEDIFLICAVPRDQDVLQEKLVIDDYITKNLYTEDNIYKINVKNGLTETVFSDQNKYFDVDKIKVLNNKVFFVNRFDNNLYEIDL
ncbi:MAG: hypothetical protein ACP5QN_00400 [Minisyncoccia bacterium]